MRFAPNARPNVMAQEKEARLRAYISRHMESLREQGVASGVTTYRLLALSLESPVASVLKSMLPELSAAGIRVEMVLLRRSGVSEIQGVDCRVVTDARLLDAHEQLVLDRATVWVGDCMRRDPLKRDAYELYSDSPVVAGHAARSFAQIWRAAGPSGTLASAERKWSGLRQASLFDPSLIAGADAMAAASPLPIRH